MLIRRQDPYLLLVSMAGVKMGDRLVQVGCAHGGRLAALAGKVGLTGRAVAVVPDSEAAARATKGAADAGVLVELETAPPTRLPIGDGESAPWEVTELLRLAYPNLGADELAFAALLTDFDAEEFENELGVVPSAIAR